MIVGEQYLGEGPSVGDVRQMLKVCVLGLWQFERRACYIGQWQFEYRCSVLAVVGPS